MALAGHQRPLQLRNSSVQIEGKGSDVCINSRLLFLLFSCSSFFFFLSR